MCVVKIPLAGNLRDPEGVESIIRCQCGYSVVDSMATTGGGGGTLLTQGVSVYSGLNAAAD